MSFEALQDAVIKAMPDQQQVDAARHEVAVRLLGPVDERPNVVTLDRAVALRNSDPDAFATLPADLRRRAVDHAEWRKHHPKTPTDQGAQQ